jgi:hypothetical protein
MSFKSLRGEEIGFEKGDLKVVRQFHLTTHSTGSRDSIAFMLFSCGVA